MNEETKLFVWLQLKINHIIIHKKKYLNVFAVMISFQIRNVFFHCLLFQSVWTFFHKYALKGACFLALCLSLSRSSSSACALHVRVLAGGWMLCSAVPMLQLVRNGASDATSRFAFFLILPVPRRHLFMSLSSLHDFQLLFGRNHVFAHPQCQIIFSRFPW